LLGRPRILSGLPVNPPSYSNDIPTLARRGSHSWCELRYRSYTFVLDSASRQRPPPANLRVTVDGVVANAARDRRHPL
jgi:hypothetical protein